MLSELLAVDTVFFTPLGYPMSYVEFAGTVLYLWSVWLVARRSMLTWPVGIASVLLFMALFWQIRLYADALEQVYYLVASAYGWWYWSVSPRRPAGAVDVGFSARRSLLAWLLFTAGASLVLGEAMTRVHLWSPALFPEPASYPRLDATTTVMSLVAMWLLARRRTESWIYWILVDVAAIWLYTVKEVRFVALLYVLLLVLAVRGFAGWRRAARVATADDSEADRSPAAG